MIQARHDAIHLHTPLDLRACTKALRNALKHSRLDVITERTLDHEIRRKLGVPVQRYVLFTVWDPMQLYQALLADGEPSITASFNIVLSENGRGTTIAAPTEAMLAGCGASIAAKFMAHSIAEEMTRILEQVAQEKQPRRYPVWDFLPIRWLHAPGRRNCRVREGGAR